MPLRKAKPPSTNLEDYAKLRDVIAALEAAGRAVVTAERQESEAILAHRRAQENLRVNLALAATNDMPQSAVDLCQRDLVKAEKAVPETKRRADTARAALAGLEERHKLVIADARKIATEAHAEAIRGATQRLIDKLLEASEASEALEDALDLASVAGVRGPHPGACLPFPGLEPARKESTSGGRGAPVIVESPFSYWLKEAQERGYRVGDLTPRLPSPSRGVSKVRPSEFGR